MKPTFESHSTAVTQTTLSLIIKSPQYESEDAPKEDLAISSFCYGENSPLYQELIYKTSLATSVSGSTMYFNNGGIHSIKLSFPTENTDKVLSVFFKNFK